MPWIDLKRFALSWAIKFPIPVLAWNPFSKLNRYRHSYFRRCDICLIVRFSTKRPCAATVHVLRRTCKNSSPRRLQRQLLQKTGLKSARIAAAEGSVTNGLPYPFLNNMSFSERVSFYATTIVTNLGFYAAGWVLAKLKSKFVE